MVIHQRHHGIYSIVIADIQSLTNSTLFAAYIIPQCKANTLRNGCVSFPFRHEDRKSSANTPSLSHLTLSTATKSNTHFTNSHCLQGDLKFRIPNLMNIFICLGRSQETVRQYLRRNLTFRCKLVPFGELQAPGPNPSVEDHVSTALDDSLLNVFTATLHTLRSQPSSAT